MDYSGGQRVLRWVMHLYGQYCPVARAAEILADRWTVLIVRELLAEVSHFNELERGLPAHLAHASGRAPAPAGAGGRGRAAGRVPRQADRIPPDPAGRDLQRIIDDLGEWGARWAFGEPRPNELDPIVLLWWMRRRVRQERIGRRRVVIQFDFRGGPTQGYWLLIEPTDVSVCLKHPGHDIDVLVTADIMAFYRVWLGRSTLAEAMRRTRCASTGRPRTFAPSRSGSPGARWRMPCAPRCPRGRGRPPPSTSASWPGAARADRRRTLGPATIRWGRANSPRSAGSSRSIWRSACSPRRSGASGRYYAREVVEFVLPTRGGAPVSFENTASGPTGVGR